MQHELRTRAFAFAPASVNETERTIELIASTGAGVQREDFDGSFLEVLSLAPGACDLSNIDGMPLLDSHRQDGLDRVLGVIRAARLEGGTLIVTPQISERHDPVWRDIRAGIIRNVSVGYRPEQHRDETDPKTGQRIRTVTRWTLMEVSLVPVAADTGAKTRNSTMTTAPDTGAALATVTQTLPAVQTRAAINQEIRALTDTFGVEPAVANDLIDRAVTAEEARAAIQECMRAQTARPAPRVTMGNSDQDPAHYVQHGAEALYARANPSHKLSEAARPYYGLTIPDHAGVCLTRVGISTTGLTKAEMIQRAAGMHTTSDFPGLLTGVGQRSLRAGYEVAPAVLKRAARQATNKDFRARNFLQFEVTSGLNPVKEGGEYRYGTAKEAKQSLSLATYGNIIAFSRQAQINDDLDAITKVPAEQGRQAAEKEAEILVALIQANPTLDDGVALFATAHGNLAVSGAAPSVTTISTARTAVRKQTGLSGKPINVAPKYLIVPPELETVGEQLLAAVSAAEPAAVNPFSGKLELLVEARLTSATKWYLAADPAMVEGLEYAYLQGEEGPQLFSRVGWEIDGIEFKVRLDFGAAFIDHRGWYQNPGV